MRRIIQLALAFSLIWALSLPVPEPVRAATPLERRVALVIGNGSYKAAPLKNPVNDARDMAAALQRLGFEVVLLTDAGLQQMDSAVREFGLKLRQGGAGLFYYAGHGLQVGGENYLVPVNAQIETESDVRFSCVPAGMVLGRMEDARNDLNIIILDACRNNPFARSFRSSELGLAKMDAPTGSLISYATAPGSVASDGAGRNGLFTQHLLKNMAVPGLPITEVFMRVRQSVVADTGRKQVPWEASSLIGQFFFAGQGAGAASVAAVKASPAAPPAQLTLDPRAEKKRLAEEAARLRQEQQELAQLQALQAEKDRLEIQRQKLEQAKLLALAPKPKQPPQDQQASSVAAPQAKAHAAQFAQLARAGLPDARAYFEQAVQARPEDVDARAGLAIAQVFSGREADAKYQLQRLNESGAQTAGVRLAKGLLLGLEGNTDSAYQLNRAMEEGADRALALLCQAASAAKRSEFDKGQKFMSDYAALVPDAERAEHVAALAKRLDVVSALAGTYSWRSPSVRSLASLSLTLTLTPQGNTLTGTGTGRFGIAPMSATVSNVRIADGKLSFLMVVSGIFSPTIHCELTCDVTGSLDAIPVLRVEYTRPVTALDQSASSRLERTGARAR